MLYSENLWYTRILKNGYLHSTLSKISRIITLIKFPTLNLYMKNFIVFHPNIKTVITNIFLRVSEILGSFWPLPAEVLKGLVNYHWIDGYCNGYLVINGDLRVLGPLAFIQAVFLHHNSKVKLFNKILSFSKLHRSPQ